MKNGVQYIDWKARFGAFNDLEITKIHPDNLYVKLNALLNILDIRPGTLEDVPELGLSMDGVMFAEEGDEMVEVLNRVESDIMAQVKFYVGEGFLQTINIDAAPVPGDNSGAMGVTFKMVLAGGIVLVATGNLTASDGLEMINFAIDDSIFGGNRKAGMIQGQRV